MKRGLVVGLAITALSVGLSGPVLATNINTSASHVATVTAAAVDIVSVSSGPTLVMNLVGAAGTDAVAATANTGSVLNYSHNSPDSRKITVSIADLSVPHTNDITLTIAAAAPGNGTASGTKTLVAAGTTSTSTGQDLITSISQGKITNDALTYNASATTTLTPAASGNNPLDYTYTVTFTNLP